MIEELSNLDIDLTGVDISRPLLPRQNIRCLIGDLRIERSEPSKPRSLIIPLTLDEPAKDTKGDTVNPGFVVTDRILIDPTGGLTQVMINERLARFQVAALGLDKPGPFGDLSQYAGRKVTVTFDVRPDKQNPEMLYQDCKRYSKAV
jgi:hypothetical protein